MVFSVAAAERWIDTHQDPFVVVRRLANIHYANRPDGACPLDCSLSAARGQPSQVVAELVEVVAEADAEILADVAARADQETLVRAAIVDIQSRYSASACHDIGAASFLANGTP